MIKCSTFVLFFFALIIIIIKFVFKLNQPPIQFEILPKVKLIGTFDEIDYMVIDKYDDTNLSGFRTGIIDKNITFELPINGFKKYTSQWKIIIKWSLKGFPILFDILIDDKILQNIDYNYIIRGIRHYNSTDSTQNKWSFSKIAAYKCSCGELILWSEHF